METCVCAGPATSLARPSPEPSQGRPGPVPGDARGGSQRLKGGKVETEIEPELNLGFQALIPRIRGRRQERLHYYKALSSCVDEGGIVEIVDDMRTVSAPCPKPEDLRGSAHDQDRRTPARRGARRPLRGPGRAALGQTRHNLDPVRLMSWSGRTRMRPGSCRRPSWNCAWRGILRPRRPCSPSRTCSSGCASGCGSAVSRQD